ncbi:unnamed protein product [Phytomonas sp. Hart1]|nr:unnamed protein product [Phytomonas sp. Hart1]|eukprot:CCW71249.1 unnamed protein product [Phytomonas sp. isolate Hart1]
MDLNGTFEVEQPIPHMLSIETINEQQLIIQNLHEIIASLKAHIHKLEGKTDPKTTPKNNTATNSSVEFVVTQNLRRRLFEENVQLKQQVKYLSKANTDLASELSSTLDVFNNMKNTLLREQEVVQKFHEKERQWAQERSLVQFTEGFRVEAERNTSALCRSFQKAATETMDWRSLCYAITTRVEPASLRKYVIDQIESLDKKYTDTEGTLTGLPAVQFNTTKNKFGGAKGCSKKKSRFLVPL